jgi:Cu(I)/Ag(I) efflux system membrane fusion protein
MSNLPPSDDQHAQELAEGEEQAPPGVRVMAWLRWLLVLAMAVVAGLSLAHHYGLLDTVQQGKHELYTCPMHPSVVSDQPGQCPICDMSLVPMSEARKASQKTTSHEQASASDEYYCPMHPEVTSHDPNATCAKCGGMKLVPRPATKELASLTLDSERAQRMGVKTAPVERGARAETLRLWGVLTASDARVSRVHARSAGYVEELFVKERATQVRKGQPILSLFSPELVAAQRELLTTQRFRAGESESAPLPDLSAAAREKLRTLGVSDADIDAIVAAGSARHALSIRAPESGFVSQKPVVQGSYVEPGALLVEITDLSEVWLIANAPESALPRLELGGAAQVRIPGEAQARKGELDFVYPEIDVAQRTAQLRIRLANRDLTLRPGLSAEVELALPARDGLFVPRAAVLDAGAQRYLFVERGRGQFAQVPVRLGERAGELVQVLEGVREGERVVTSAAFLLDSETRLHGSLDQTEQAPATPVERER